jgi:hypothetical protein
MHAPSSSSTTAATEQEPTKFQAGEVVRVARGELKGAPYNPRKLSTPAQRRLRDNIKRVGLLGPAIVWNRRTGNVVSGHQRLAILDALEGRGDYALDVTAVELTDAEEREQNVFMNAPDAQGDWDTDLLAELLAEDDVNWEHMGLDQITIESMFSGTEHADLIDTLFSDEKESPVAQAQKSEAERIARVKGADAYAQRKLAERENADAYVCLVFSTRGQMARFLEHVGQEPDLQYVDGREVALALGVPEEVLAVDDGDEDDAEG